MSRQPPSKVAYFTQTISYQDMVSPTRGGQPRAFCLNRICVERAERQYRVQAQMARSVDVRRVAAPCPHCGHTVFWSRIYHLAREYSPMQALARKTVGLRA